MPTLWVYGFPSPRKTLRFPTEMMSRHQEGGGVESSLVLFPYGNDVGGKLVVVSRRKPRSHRYLVNSTFGVIASVAAMAVLIYMCGFPKIALGHRHTGHRSLSAHGKSSDSDSFPECEGIFASGAPPSREPSAGGSLTELPLRSAVLPPMDTDTSTGSTGSEASGKGGSNSGSEASGSSSSRKRKHAASTSSSAPGYEKRHPKKRWLLLATGEFPSDLAPQTASATEYESQPWTSAAAHRYQDFIRGAGTALEQADEGSARGRQDAELLLQAASQWYAASSVRAALWHQATESPNLSRTPVPGEPSSSSALHFGTVAGAPRNSCAAPSPITRRSVLVDSFLFRLPRLQSGVRGRLQRLDWKEAMKSSCSTRQATEQLQSLINAFKKETLNTYQAESMLSSVQGLLGYMVSSESQQLPHLYPSQGVLRLGRRYVILDILLSALVVLEEPLGENWQEFILKVPLKFKETENEARHAHKQGMFNRRLLKLIRKGLKHLKRGDLPPSSLRKAIHELLFFDFSGPSRLKRTKWNPWC